MGHGDGPAEQQYPDDVEYQVQHAIGIVQFHYVLAERREHGKAPAILILTKLPGFRLRGWRFLEAFQHEIHQGIPTVEAQVAG